MKAGKSLAVFLYLINLSLLMTHEVDSAVWKEWDLFGLPGGAPLFVAIHVLLIGIALLGFKAVILGTKYSRLWAGALASIGLVAVGIHSFFLLTGHDEFFAPVSLAILGLILPTSLTQLAQAAVGFKPNVQTQDPATPLEPASFVKPNPTPQGEKESSAPQTSKQKKAAKATKKSPVRVRPQPQDTPPEQVTPPAQVTPPTPAKPQVKKADPLPTPKPGPSSRQLHAATLRLKLEYGLASVEEAIAWADLEILGNPKPADALLRLSLARGSSVAEIDGMLAELSPSVGELTVLRAVLGELARNLTSDKRRGRAIAKMLSTISARHNHTLPADLDKMNFFDDRYDFIELGVGYRNENVEDVTGDLQRFLDGFRDRPQKR